jgi:hypothetical protein
MRTRKEVQGELRLLSGFIKNKSKRRRVIKQVKKNLEYKYGVVI